MVHLLGILQHFLLMMFPLFGGISQQTFSPSMAPHHAAQSHMDDLSSTDPYVYVVALLGQSQAAGWDCILSDNPSPSFPLTIPNTWIFDKYKRDNRKTFDLYDSSRGNEDHILRPLTVGYAGTGTNYPWEFPDVDPHYGPEMSMANTFITARGGRLVVCKTAFGGTAVMDLAGADDWNVDQSMGGSSFTSMFLQSYWNPTIDKAVAMAGGDRSKVRVLGIVWFQGFSDGRTLPQALQYAENAHNTLTTMRDNMQLSNPGEMPIHVFMTDLSSYNGSTPLAELPTIRAQQLLLAENSGSQWAIPNCTVTDSMGLPVNPNSFPHFSAEGFDTLGQMMGSAFIPVPGSRITP